MDGYISTSKTSISQTVLASPSLLLLSDTMTARVVTLLTALSLLSLGRILITEAINENIKVCQTFGSGVVESFSSEAFYLSTTCPTTLLHFAHNDVDYRIITTRGKKSGLIERVELTLNKIKTVVENGKIFVEDK
ncbi:hypothetical protein JZ751_003555, partial [Albula glossodonta]